MDINNIVIRKVERQDVPLLLDFIRGIARYGKMEWMSLDWNKPSNNFYRSLGAVPIDDCTVYRLDAVALEQLSTTK